MIPLLRTDSPETAANLLAKNFRRVLIMCHYDNRPRIRFRADKLKDERVFFGKVPSQIKFWQERGGCLISWRRVDGLEGPHEALLFAECPKSMEGIYYASRFTSQLAVVYMPPTWIVHENTIRNRHEEKRPEKFARQMHRFDILKTIIPNLPALTPRYLEARLARGSFQSSSSPERPGDEDFPFGIAR